MRRFTTILFVTAAVLAIVPQWVNEAPRALLGRSARMTATPVLLDERDPKRVRVGGLTFLGGLELKSPDPAFGGFSALAVVGDRFTLLSDSGALVRFRMGADWRPKEVRFADLPAGPGTGWQKADRDSESMAIDPATGRAWVGFEGGNSLWRFAADFARGEAWSLPPAMRRWDENGGPETLVRLPDGRFLTISETTHVLSRLWRGSEAARLHSRAALIFEGDPTAAGTRVRRFAYAPHGKYDPADAAALPNGDLLVLDRGFRLPFHWSNRLSVVPGAELKPGRVARGRLLAVLDAPLVHDNFEGVAVTREGADTIVWLVSDDNQMWLQRSLLLKFRLEAGR